jgi:hypothetical protein
MTTTFTSTFNFTAIAEVDAFLAAFEATPFRGDRLRRFVSHHTGDFGERRVSFYTLTGNEDEGFQIEEVDMPMRRAA